MRVSAYPTVESRNELLGKLRLTFNSDTITSKQLQQWGESHDVAFPWFVRKDDRKISRGIFSLADEVDGEKTTKRTRVAATRSPKVANVSPEIVIPMRDHMPAVAKNVTESFVPEKDSTYAPFGFFRDLKKIIDSKQFYPIYITGLSGNGKTMMVEQVCASLGREMIRANIVRTTDETDLIGSYELVDGNTILREGPVIVAMRRGAVLLLDEVDLGSEHLLCIQPVLEGKPYFNKKTGELIHPAPGFTVIATANTKGKGSEDGRFIGTNVLNEAFLERFAITVEQQYPSNTTERKILQNNCGLLGVDEPEFVERLVLWADMIRTSYMEGAVDEIISTRRLVHIVKAFSIFRNRMKAVEMCLNRFDTETKTAFLDFYTKVDADAISSDTADQENENE
jgi:hypothetical protein